jgi:hypothetical protein
MPDSYKKTSQESARLLNLIQSVEDRATKTLADISEALSILGNIIHSDSILNPLETPQRNYNPCIPLKPQEPDTAERHEKLADGFLDLKKRGMSAQKAWTKLADMPGTMLAPDTVRDIVTRNITERILSENQLMQKKIEFEERVKLLSKKFYRSPSRIKRLLQKAERKEP